jgi:hypothetical protein
MGVCVCGRVRDSARRLDSNTGVRASTSPDAPCWYGSSSAFALGLGVPRALHRRRVMGRRRREAFLPRRSGGSDRGAVAAATAAETAKLTM